MKKRKKISDLTVLLIVRLDSIDRLENLLAVTQFINSHFIVKISVLECAPFNNRILKRLLDKSIQYTFQEDSDPILYRTRFLNQMIKEVNTPYVAIWDTDVIAPIGLHLKLMKKELVEPFLNQKALFWIEKIVEKNRQTGYYEEIRLTSFLKSLLAV